MNPIKVNGTYDSRAYLISNGKEYEIGELESNWVENIHGYLQYCKQNNIFSPNEPIALLIVGKRYDLSESYRSEHKINLNSSKSYIESLIP